MDALLLRASRRVPRASSGCRRRSRRSRRRGRARRSARRRWNGRRAPACRPGTWRACRSSWRRARTSPRTSSSAPPTCRAVDETPVGARYSPNTPRKTLPHSPVVTPALAAAIEGSTMLRPSLAAARKLLQRGLAPPWRRAARARRSAGRSAPASTWCGTTMIVSSPAVSGEGSPSGEFVDADDDLLAGLDRLEARGVGLDQLRFHIAAFDRGGRAAERVDLRQARPGPLPSAPRPCAQISRIAVENVAIFQAGRSHRP